MQGSACRRELERLSGIEKQALRKLDMLHTARDLKDLRAPAANRLEAVTVEASTPSGSMISGASVSLGRKEGPADVEIVDYH